MGVDFTAVKIDTTDIFIWGIRKMIFLGYFSSGDAVPEHWQARYDREQDDKDYRKFRDEGGFDDNSDDDYIGSVGDKSWYYDKEGQVYSETDEEEDLNIGWEK